VDALYDVNRTFHLLIKPDNLTCYQQHFRQNLLLACDLSGPIST
jgi:hypothetical protein